MNRKMMTLLGWGFVVLGIAAYIFLQKLGQGQSGFFTVGAIGSGVLFGCVAEGIDLIRAGGSEEQYRKHKAKHSDERSIAVERRSARITLYATWALCFAAVVWQTVAGNTAVAQMFDAALVLSILIFVAVSLIIDRKM